ncbi:hypothetical protein [Thermoanaerobacterium thermosaccharolyticum]|uniref:hypothetical protein n=1 Tax=Thermoanaerobacterium thermosaccharolyticum TaxID=1517 RepID=UPI000C07ACEA|nr:hypothetical protein [Thermoanaerobacterium thermosaccharolyticum]
MSKIPKITGHNYRTIGEDIDKIIDMKRNGCKDRDIANKLNRSYWGIVWKLRDLRAKNMI